MKGSGCQELPFLLEMANGGALYQQCTKRESTPVILGQIEGLRNME
jgi:hypothetical protein